MSRSMQMTGAWHGLMAQTICNLIFTEKSWTLLFFLSELWSRAHQAVKCCIWYINSVLAVNMFFSSGIAPRYLLHGLRFSRRCKGALFEQSWCFMGNKLLHLQYRMKTRKEGGASCLENLCLICGLRLTLVFTPHNVSAHHWWAPLALPSGEQHQGRANYICS